ncbi:hypothetical protein IG631_13660 [Alternaria alternata]|nr:hypothetical protein IG631_13660 [Alternaria alternata]
MRLLNVNTRQLEEFSGDAVPPYAILSHTWGPEEVTLQDLARQGHQQKQGYTKIEGCCQQAKKDGLLWVWVDTCCIDKTSSAELSEAINSMFRWYEASEVCYAYLQDVPSASDIYAQDSAFRNSRWFTRGWTLQELLAPRLIRFYDTAWMLVSPTNTRDSSNTAGEAWVTLLSDVTSIHKYFLLHRWSLRFVSAAYKFSWMAKRRTTRVEDQAYCLLGLLDINMPLLYGEGIKAFIRLQEAVLSGSDDISLLAWGYNLPCSPNDSYLATSPAAFLEHPKENFWRHRRTSRTHTTVTGRGLHIELFMVLIDAQEKIWLGIVEEQQQDGDRFASIGILLKQDLRGDGKLFARASGCPPVRIFKTGFWKGIARTSGWKLIYIGHDGWHPFKVTESNVWDSRPLLPRLDAPSSRPSFIMNISSVSIMGYSFASSWPSVLQRWPGFLDGSVLVCVGPHSNLFYMIFSNEKQEKFALKVHLRWNKYSLKSADTLFGALSGKYCVTAAEHCRGTKIGSKAPQFAKDIHWSPYFATRNIVTNENGHVCATYEGGSRKQPLVELAWKKGLYIEGG